MRATTTLNLALALGAALAAAAALAPAPAAALDRYEDGSRISHPAPERARAADAAARDVARADAPNGTAGSARPAEAAAPCPGTGSQGGVWLNGLTFNGWSMNGVSSNGKLFNGFRINGRNFNGTAAAARTATGAPGVTAVRLPDGRTFTVPAR